MKSMLDRTHSLLEKLLKHVAHGRLLGIGHDNIGIIGGSWLPSCGRNGQHWTSVGRLGRLTRRRNDMNVEINFLIS